MDIFSTLNHWLWSAEPLIAIQNFFGRGWLPVFQFLSLLGNVQLALPVIAVVFWLTGRIRAYTILAAVLFGLLISSLIWMAFNFLPVAHPRPSAPNLTDFENLSGASFPSGHTVTAILLWGSLVRFGWLSLVVVLILVALDMLSRLYLGTHFLGDVLLSVPLALLLFWIFYRVWPRFWGWLTAEADRVSGVLSGASALGLVLGVAAFFFVQPDQWPVPGGIAALGLGLGTEFRFVRYKPVSLSRRRQVSQLGLGLGGLLPLVVISLLLVNSYHAVSALVFGLAVLWGVLAAPLLFIQLGLAARYEQPTAERLATNPCHEAISGSAGHS